MADLRELNVVISSDISGLSKGLNDASKRVGNFTGQVQTANDRLAAVGKTLSGIGTGLSIGVSLPLGMAGFAAIKMASDFEESLNKTRVVFKEGASVIEEFAGRGAQALGLSRQQALESAATFGNLFTSMGMTRIESAKMSTQIVQLAVDLASFNNIRPEDALYKLRAGLVGEAEPLRALGVQLSETAVAAQAMKMGLAETAKQLTASDKVTARYALILEQTKNAQGDFARTSEGMANQQRTLAAQVKDLGVQFGQVLLPAATSVIQSLNKMLGVLQAMSPAAREATIAIGAFAVALGPATKALGMIINQIVAYRAATVTLGIAGTNIASIGEGWKLVAAGMAGVVVQIGVVAAAFWPFLARLNSELKGITSEAGNVADTLAKAMVADPALYQQHLAYLEKLKSEIPRVAAMYDGMGLSLSVGTEATYENARALLQLIDRVKALGEAEKGLEQPGDAMVATFRRQEEQGKKAANAMIEHAKAVRGLKDEYGVMTRGDIQAAMKDIASDFANLAKEGASAQELMAGFQDKVAGLAERAKSYKDLAIPTDFQNLTAAMSEGGGSINAVDALATKLATSLPTAAQQAQASVVEIFKGDEIAQSVSGGFGRGVEEGISYGDQQLEAWRQDVGDRVWTIKLDLDTEEAERKLGELRDGYRKAGAVMP